MNNKEKQQYLSDLNIYRSTSFIYEIQKRNAFVKQMPKVLFKYKTFNSNTYDMLSNGYVYLAPVEGLDDPFDCLTNSGINSKKTANDILDFVIQTVFNLGNCSFDKKEVKKLILPCIKGETLDEDEMSEQIFKTNILSEKEKSLILISFKNLTNLANSIAKDKSVENISITALYPQGKVGVCSLSTKRDNKVMWSLYSQKYEGCCIEYEIPNDNNIRFNLVPVIYKKNDDNDLVHKITKFALANCIRIASQGRLNNGIGSLNELFCTKDTDWSYQDEWRLLGDAGAHCSLLKIKIVYLGFKVKDSIIKKLIKISIRKGFSIYKMNSPSGKKNITYTKII